MSNFDEEEMIQINLPKSNSDPLCSLPIKTIIEAMVMLGSYPIYQELSDSLRELALAEVKYQLELQKESIEEHNQEKLKKQAGNVVELNKKKI